MIKNFIIILLLSTLCIRGQKDSLGIVFNKNTATINFTCSNMSKVDTLIKILNNNPSWIVEIVIQGSELEANYEAVDKLHLDRLKIIRDFLISKGIDGQRLLTWRGDHPLILSDKKNQKATKKLSKTNECDFMKVKCYTYWRLLSKDFIDPNAK